MNRKKQKELEKKANRCKGCPNCCEYVDREYKRRKMCLAFEYIWLNQKYIDGCPLEKEEE